MQSNSETEISLLDALRTGGYEASLITTFNAYLPFYEEVVLRHLLAAGCRYNLVLMDASQYRMALADKHLRPRLAGRSYTLIPVSASGVFHPKLLMLLGNKKGLLHVGSHNLTLSGFGHNRELTNQVVVASAEERNSIELIRHAHDFARGWLENGHIPAPKPLLSAFDRLRPFAPWLKKRPTEGLAEARFIGVLPSGPSLFDQLVPLLPERPKRIIMMGPFFDRQLEFLNRFADLAPDAELIVAIDPETVELLNPEKAPTKTKFVVAGALGAKDGYLHAKVLLVEGAAGEVLLVTGSANPSSPAWLAPANRGNAEAVLARWGDRAEEAASALGLLQIGDCPALTETQWASLRQRSVDATESTRSTPPNSSGVFAIATDDRVEFHGLEHTQAVDASLLDDDEQELVRGVVSQSSGAPAHLSCPKELVGRVRLARLDLGGGLAIISHVHHVRDIEALSQTSKQTTLRTALASLEGDQPDIAGLMATVSRLIFDEDHARPIRPAKSSAKDITPKPTPSGELGPLALSLANDSRKQRKRKRLLREGDLASLLDVLIYHLGQGLDLGTAGLDKKGRSEEEQTNKDDEEDEDEKKQADAEAWIDLCARKVGTLVSRVLRQLADSPPDGEAALRPILQLFAVLATLRHLRSCDSRAKWSLPGRTLVPLKQRERLLRGALAHLFGRSRQLLDAAERAVEDATTDELTRLRGLLLWLAWDCGISFDAEQVFQESPRQLRNRLYQRAVLAALSPHIAVDVVAQDEARSCLRQAAPAASASVSVWLERSIKLGREIADALTEPATEPTVQNPAMGDIVTMATSAMPHVVLRPGATAELLDFGEKPTSFKWSQKHLKVLQLSQGRFHSSLSGL